MSYQRGLTISGSAATPPYQKERALSCQRDWLVTSQNLRWHHGSFAFHLPDQQVVAFDPACQDRGPSALLFSEDLMRQLLDEEDSSLVWTVLGEKNISGYSPRRGLGKSWQFLESVH